MGRRPNAIILKYFERGPKLSDNSNRYPHTCKACGENFPKGRIDSLTVHLTRKCPAIKDHERLSVELELNGVGIASPARAIHPGHHHYPAQDHGISVDHLTVQDDWTALETLAEVSRQVDRSEKHDDRSITLLSDVGLASAIKLPASVPLQDHGPSQDAHQPRHHGPVAHPPQTEKRLSSDSNIAALVEKRQVMPENAAHPATDAFTNLSMAATAAAATARLNRSLLDPQLLVHAAVSTAPRSDTRIALAPPMTAAPNLGVSEPRSVPLEAPSAADGVPYNITPTASASQPWGELTHPHANSVPIAPMSGHDALHGPTYDASPTKGGCRLNTAGLSGSKSRHARARFNATRRKQVQEVRKLCACFRCRILRKTCSMGHPCDACRKVLSPRVWRSGCVRTKLSEQLDLFTAGVQIVLAQNRINSMKSSIPLANNGVTVELYHFPEVPTRLLLQVLQIKAEEGNAAEARVIMLDNDRQDVPNRVETYMRQTMSAYLERESSAFVRSTLQTAQTVVAKTNDELLRRALEFWVLVEILDRERQWTIEIIPPPGRFVKRSAMTEEKDPESYSTICLQLAAATERRAAATGMNLLASMQRRLQDSKKNLDYGIFFATLILLNCIEKSTWAFKAWSQESLRPMWPLEREPASFTQQGYHLAYGLRMLLGIRKVLPQTFCRESDGILCAHDQDATIVQFFATLNLSYDQVKKKHEQPTFLPENPRSLEMAFCSALLLPGPD